MYDFSEKLLNDIKAIVNDSEPLGPLDITDVENLEVQKVLFESQNKIYKSITKHPSIVVGRRGSGKTTFLKSLVHGKPKSSVIVEITGARAFERVVDALQNSLDDIHVFAESVAELWDWIFWTSLLSAVDEELKENNKASRDNLTLKVLQFAPGLDKVLSILSHSKTDSIALLSNVLKSHTGYSPENLRGVKEQVNIALRELEMDAFVLLDSVEDYRLETDRMGLAISGLLKAAGRFNQTRGAPEIRVCIPAELYHKFREYSSNSIKDFRHQLVLHWHAGELLSLAAHRYRLYLNVQPSKKPQALLDLLNQLDIHSRSGALEFWRILFPERITNAVGIEEDPIAYLLRHTHLLPRQIIYFLNAILRINNRMECDSTQIAADSIVSGVASAESEIWLEVCNAYRSIYPDAEAVVRAVIGELPLVFDNGLLHKIYNRHGKRALSDSAADFYYFKKMLIEIGCIGAVVSETGRYVVGVFEYTEGQALSVSTKTKLCLHPLFCGGEKTLNATGVEKVIYPYGSDPQGDDRRDL